MNGREDDSKNDIDALRADLNALGQEFEAHKHFQWWPENSYLRRQDKLERRIAALERKLEEALRWARPE